MSIESALYIQELNASNPPSTDPVGQAAAHLRLIKSVLQNTFPNLNHAAGVVPTGGIIFWSALQGSIPSGWGTCDGSVYARLDGTGNITTPDLRDKFIAIAGVLRPVDTTGGTESVTPALTIAGHALTVAELPSHNHTVTDAGHTHAITDPGHTHVQNGSSFGFSNGPSVGLLAGGTSVTQSSTTGITINSAITGITINNTGSGDTHNHTGTVTVTTVPSYYSLIAIMRL